MEIPKERRLIIKHYKKGVKLRKIGDMLEIPHTKAYYWVKRYEQYGMKGLNTKKQPGKIPLLRKEDLSEIKHFLISNKPIRYNGLSSGWTSREVKSHIQKEFNIHYSLRHIERLLHNLGFSLITPRTRNVKASLSKQTYFKRKFKKNLKMNIWDCR